MIRLRTFFVPAILAIATSSAGATITARWRVVPAPPYHTTAVPFNAVTLSLLVDLSIDSRFNSAGLFLPPDLFGSAAGGFTLYHHAFGHDNDKPNPVLLPAFPDLFYDSYVSTTLPSGNPATVHGRYSGAAGGAALGPSSVDIAWAAPPGAAPPGGFGLEIARITLSRDNGGPFFVGLTPFAGEVRDDVNPGVAVPVPPLPIAVPEPTMASLAIGTLWCVVLRRR